MSTLSSSQELELHHHMTFSVIRRHRFRGILFLCRGYIQSILSLAYRVVPKLNLIKFEASWPRIILRVFLDNLFQLSLTYNDPIFSKINIFEDSSLHEQNKCTENCSFLSARFNLTSALYRMQWVNCNDIKLSIARMRLICIRLW